MGKIKIIFDLESTLKVTDTTLAEACVRKPREQIVFVVYFWRKK